MSGYQRSYAYAGNGVAFACTEVSSEPLPPPTVPGIGGGSELTPAGRAALGEVVAQLAVEPSEAAQTAAIERARLVQLERAEMAATALRQHELEQAARQRRAVERAAARPRPALEPVPCRALPVPRRLALESGRRP